jgi:GMP reductase
MRIEYDIKLGFKDVMFRPKRSTLKSRSQVSLEREFTFRNSKKTWTGVPIIAANMDTVGTFEMATALASEKIMTAIHKHYSIEEWSEFLENSPESIYQYIAISSGTGSADEEKIKQIIGKFPKIDFICIDVANGYSEHFVNFVKKVRAIFQIKPLLQEMW